MALRFRGAAGSGGKALTAITDNLTGAQSVAYTYDANGNQTSNTQGGFAGPPRRTCMVTLGH